MTLRIWLSALALGGLLLGAASVAQAAKKPGKEPASFGVLHAPSADEVRGQAESWLKGTGKMDEATQKAFTAIWAQAERPLLDRVSETLTLGDPEAGKLLAAARDTSTPAPKEVPAQIKDTKLPQFYRANLALAYAKGLSGRRVYEEALGALKSVPAEQVVDPAAYYFHRAVAEHALVMKGDALRSIARLIEDVQDAPDRYRFLGMLMLMDMQRWKEKDLDWISRKMDNIERRLDLARGGPQTQKIQKDVVNRLDELIKQLENQCKGSCQCNGGGCPNGGQSGGGGAQGPSPQMESMGGQNSGPGKVDEKKLKELAEGWGKLPEKERAKAMMDLTRDMPQRYREVIENYFKRLAQNTP